MMCLVVNRSLYRKVRAVYAPDDLVNTYARELFVALEESFRADREDIDFLLEKIESEELRGFVLAQHSLDVYSRNPERNVEESVAFIKRKKHEARALHCVLQDVSFWPGVIILLFVLGWNLLGDAFRDVLDPRSGR